MADLSMTFNNLMTKTKFIGRDDFWLSPVSSYSQRPDKVMQASDTQVFAIDHQFFAGAGATWFWCCWYDEVTKIRFGVKIDAGIQPFGAGNRPTWLVMFDRNDQAVDPKWTPSGADPSSSYHWDKSIGFDIVANPVSGHETLTITITIQQL